MRPNQPLLLTSLIVAAALSACSKSRGTENVPTDGETPSDAPSTDAQEADSSSILDSTGPDAKIADDTLPPDTQDNSMRDASPQRPVVVYVGSGDGRLSRYAMDGSNGSLTFQSFVRTGNYPSFLALSPDGMHAYACNEADGTLASLSVAPTTGALTLLGTPTAADDAATYVATDRSGKWVFTANYSAANVMVFPVNNGVAGPVQQTVATGTNPHAITTDPTNRFVFVPCKGADRIEQYRFDATTGALTANSPPFIATATGAGPRHLAFHPSGKYAYVIGEIDSTMAAYAVDGTEGTLQPLGRPLSTLPAGQSAAAHTAAEVVVAPDGRFVYGSNRSYSGSNSIAIFAVDVATGLLTPVGHQDTTGKTPRSFTIEPSGRFLFVANQDSNNVVTFRIDAERGTLSKLASTPIGSQAYWVGAFPLP